MKIYAISDTHFGHDRLVQLSGRPIDFTQQILVNLSKVGGDLLIHCGDFCIGRDEHWIGEFMKATLGFKQTVLVRGNHDKKSDFWYLERGFNHVCEAMLCKYFGKQILFTHMPVKRDDKYWSPHFPPDFNVHGHLHGSGNHRVKERNASLYDPAWHKDLAPEIHALKPVNLEVLIANKAIKQLEK